MSLRFAAASAAAIPIWFVHRESWPAIRDGLPAAAAAFAAASGFEPTAGQHAVLPDASGGIAAVVAAIEAPDARHRDPFLPGKLANLLPAATYRFANEPHETSLAALGWLLAGYRFNRYKTSGTNLPALIAPAGIDVARIERIARSTALARDLVNTPANDLGPAALEAQALAVAQRYGAAATVVRGNALVTGNLPLIYAVGKASPEPPCLVDFIWGDPTTPKVTLVGKGVCFDTGGLDIKPESAMALMKKDMGGAATALAAADAIMDAGVKVRLRVLLPIVENAISGTAFRPGDVYPSRKGLTVEIGNTDAEGRLILADALALADEEKPDLLFDFATLTGAARVALGPDIPPFYTGEDALAEAIAHHSRRMNDPVWRMPLWDPYDALLDGKIANLNNISGGPFAGSITAALFLRRFVEAATAWAHFDIFAWNPKSMPGRPEGGETQASRLVYDLIETRYGV
ncbi:MAG: leucyl aminopeptidase family protein [Methylobacteriaceae bacterium]|nr:leucyl aminopeptidase family protein [Methylobacteriaceae bacterium]